METELKTKIGFRQGDWNQQNNEIEKGQHIMQELWQVLSTSGLDISKVDIQQLLSNPLEYLITQMPQDFQKTASMVEKSALKFPSSMKPLIAAIPGILQELKSAQAHRWISFFQFDENGVTVKESELEKLRENCTDYCENEKQVECYELIKQAQELLTELNKKYLNIPEILGWSTRINPLAEVFLLENGVFKIKANFIKKVK